MNNSKVVYLGPEGTFTHEAALNFFGKDNVFIPVMRIKDVFTAIYTGTGEYGVVPAENSTGGVIADTLDLFINTRLKVHDEIKISIKQNIMSNSDRADIKRIYSHPQSFLQCSQYISSNFPDAELIETNSNTEAAIMASNDKYSASIGPEMTASMYALKIVESGINDNKDNITRFFIVSNKCREEFRKKSVILFSVPNKFGALYSILKIFKDNKCNMTQIASRPARTKNWDYVFVIEFENLENIKKNKRMIDKIKMKTDFFDYLGTF